MRPVQYSVRLPVELDKALRKLAKQQGISPYAALQRSVKAGIAAQTDASDGSAEIREMVSEVASISARLAGVEGIMDRTLFTACAAYCYARSAALGAGKTDEIITVEIHRAYDRQKAKAQGRS